VFFLWAAGVSFVSLFYSNVALYERYRWRIALSFLPGVALGGGSGCLSKVSNIFFSARLLRAGVNVKEMRIFCGAALTAHQHCSMVLCNNAASINENIFKRSQRMSGCMSFRQELRHVFRRKLGAFFTMGASRIVYASFIALHFGCVHRLLNHLAAEGLAAAQV